MLVSIALHASLFIGIAVYSLLGVGHGAGWGSDWNSGGVIHVKTVASLPGIPLPAPAVTSPNTVHVENPGLYKAKPEPRPKPVKEAVTIPKFKESVNHVRPLRANPRIQKQPFIPPANAIPFGQGGNPLMNYSPVIAQGGQGGLAFGDNSFGVRYGWYVQAVRSRISSNWLTTMISPNILSAPRVYVDFDILRDGTIVNARVTQSSGIAEVDRAALRAVVASSPLGPLPPGYSGNKVSVEFYFDFHR